MASDSRIVPLYRYQACPEGDGRKQDWIRSVLVDHKLYFPRREDFNDPFDCVVPSFMENTSAVLKGFAQQLVERNFSTASDKEKAERVAALMSNPTYFEGMRRDLQRDVDRAGILCLSKVRDDILMWAHYAGGHKGLCFEFDGSDDRPFFGEAQAVVYDDYRPLPLDEDADKQMERVLLTKSPHWRYEREFRIFLPDRGRTAIDFPVESLTGIIFGCWMPEPVRSLVKDWATQGGCRVAFFEARPMAGKFGLDIVKVD